MTDKVIKLIKGAVFGIVAGIFAVFALIYLLHSLSWGIWELLDIGAGPWLGFLITGTLILLLGVIAGLLAMRFIKKGSPPTPQLAIEEAQLIKGTLTASPSGHAVGQPAEKGMAR
jgi:Putative Actinobacterial Holin-X, holin superfamily III